MTTETMIDNSTKETQETEQVQVETDGFGEIDESDLANAFYDANSNETVDDEQVAEEPEGTEEPEGEDTDTESDEDQTETPEETPPTDATNIDWKSKYEEASSKIENLEHLRGKHANEVGEMRQRLKVLEDARQETNTQDKKIAVPDKAKELLLKKGYDEESIEDMAVLFQNMYESKEQERERQRKIEAYRENLVQSEQYVLKEIENQKMEKVSVIQTMAEVAKENPSLYLVETDNGVNYSSGEAIKECFKIAKNRMALREYDSLKQKNEQLQRELEDLKKTKKVKGQIPVNTGKTKTKKPISDENVFEPFDLTIASSEFREANLG